MVYRSFHTDDVINQVKIRECLWNPRDMHYGDKFAKQHAWYEICMIVIPKFNKRPFEEQTLIAKAVQARWKTARDAFMKCINEKGKKFTYRSKSNYIHYHLLTFLQKVKDYEDEIKKGNLEESVTPEETPIEEDDTTILSNDEDDTEEIDFNMDMNDADANPELPSNDPEISTNVVDNTIEYAEPGPSNNDDQTEPVIHKPNKRAQRNHSPTPRCRKRKAGMSEFETNLLKIMNARFESKSVLQEDDQNFFNSLAPMIKDFSNYQKLHFRSKMLEIIKEVQCIPSVRIKDEPICVELHNTGNENNNSGLRDSITFEY